MAFGKWRNRSHQLSCQRPMKNVVVFQEFCGKGALFCFLRKKPNRLWFVNFTTIAGNVLNRCKHRQCELHQVVWLGSF